MSRASTCRAGAVAVVAAVAGLTAIAPSAHAGVFQYCGVPIGPGSWCGNNDLERRYGYNEATRNVSSQVTLCQRTIYANTQIQHQATCGVGSANNTFTQDPVLEAEVYHTANAQLYIYGAAFD